jgi:tetratricopeptide (TPR) repeat protein
MKLAEPPTAAEEQLAASPTLGLTHSLTPGQLHDRIMALTSAPGDGEDILAGAEAWDMALAVLQDLVQDRAFGAAQELIARMRAASPDQAFLLDGMLRFFEAPTAEPPAEPPTSQPAPLVQQLPEVDEPEEETPASAIIALAVELQDIAPTPDMTRAVAEAVTGFCQYPDPGQDPAALQAAAARLAAVPAFRPLLAPLWRALLGLPPEPGLKAALERFSERGAVAGPLLLLLLADEFLNAPPGADAVERAVTLLGPQASDLASGLMAVPGGAPAARRLQLALLGAGLATPRDCARLAQVEQMDPAGLDPLAILDIGVLLHPGNALLRVERAKLLLRHGQREEAVAEARTGAGLQEGQGTDVALGLADLLSEAGLLDEALAILDAALVRWPEEPMLLQRACRFEQWRGRPEAALPLARRAAAVAPQDTETLELLARLLAGQERRAEAEAMLRRALAIHATPALHVAFVDIVVPAIWPTIPDYVDWTLVKDLETSLAKAEEALSDDRLWEAVRLLEALSRPDALRRLVAQGAARRRAAGDLSIGAELRRLLERLLAFGGAEAPDPAALAPAALARALGRQGLAHLAAGKHLRAETCFELAMLFDPTDPAARFNRGFAAIGAGHVTDALASFEGMSRIFEPDMERVAWPRVEGIAWPHAPLGRHADFEALKPAGTEWPLITVVTPSYNQAAYVEETILSVLNQGYPRVQYIVVDGLSKDGSQEVIERYRARIDTVIIEKDRGQTEAINKGLRLAKGEIVTWLNSDDMLAPGALHAIALSWLRSRADLIFGFCLPHREHAFNLANLPRATPETFTVTHLGEIFRYWMKGFFFYQPEVFFSRAILERAGLLEENLYFTMDYEFWLRCAAAGAMVEAVPWPIALFRQHREQKTANLLDCMLEQAEVRDRFLRLEPSSRRRMEVRKALQSGLARRRRPRIGVVTSRLAKIFSEDVAPDLRQMLAAEGLEVRLVQSAAELDGQVDAIVKLVHLQGDEEEIEALRRSGFTGPIAGWFWDNHHHLFANYEVAEKLDVLVPGHDFARHYLRNREAVDGPALPLCVTQWSQRQAARFWRLHGALPRSDLLYGGFVRYPFARKRNALIERLIAGGFEGVYFLPEGMLERYFAKTPDDRFREWAEHKASITLPLAGDLSQRMFDALLTGQVPIVPADVHDLDAVVPPELQASLPVIRFARYDLASVREAHAKAIAAFDAGGAAGAEARHRFALERHTLVPRIRSLVATLRDLADRL